MHPHSSLISCGANANRPGGPPLLGSSLLALALLAQAPAVAAISQPAAGPKSPAQVAANDTVTIAPPELLYADRSTLIGVIDLVNDPKETDAAKHAQLDALLGADRIVQLREPTRLMVRDVAADRTHTRISDGEPMMVFSGVILDGRNARRTVVGFTDQIAAPARPDGARPPTAEELAAQEALDRADRERADRVYRAARTAKNAARAKAGFADPSVRKHVLARATAAWRQKLMKAEQLSEGELDAIIARGEDLDGTADQLAARNLGGKARARAANDAQLMAIGAMIDRAGAQFLANKAANDARAARAAAEYAQQHPGSLTSIPPMLGARDPGGPWGAWLPAYQFRTTPR